MYTLHEKTINKMHVRGGAPIHTIYMFLT